MTELAAGGDKRMTVWEVAATLGVTDEAIKKHIRELYPNLMRNGIATYLSESQVMEIKQKMLPTTEVVGALTDMEAGMMAVRAMEHFKARFEQEQVLRQAAESRLAIAEPKAKVLDKITATDSDISVRELAAILAVPHLGQNNLFERLRTDGYIDSLNRPYRQYIEAGLMYEKEYYVPQMDATKRQLRITQKGAAHFAAKYAPCRAARRERAGELFVSLPSAKTAQGGGSRGGGMFVGEPLFFKQSMGKGDYDIL